MRLYVKTSAPSALKVLIFCDESGRSVEQVEVDDPRSTKFLGLNPFGTVPVLVTDSGRPIAESLTICRYLDRKWKSGLFGQDDEEVLQVEVWERRAELQFYVPAIDRFHLMQSMSGDEAGHDGEAAKRLASRVQRAAGIFNEQLELNRFVAGERFTAADITAFLGVSGLIALGAIDLSQFNGLRRWSEETGSRSSMNTLRAIGM